MFKVSMTKRAKKSMAKMPAAQAALLAMLIDDLRESGPLPPLGSLLAGNRNRRAYRGLLCWQS
jgi:mRNA-degrading endonuclease RelE of RelBE toxin-antitoxin system